MNLGTVKYYNQNIYINENKISGVIDFKSDVSMGLRGINILGYGYVDTINDSEITKSFNFVKYTSIEDDKLIYLCDDVVTGILQYKENDNNNIKKFSAMECILTSYEFNCSLGEIPTSSFSYDCLENIGSFQNNVPLNNDQINSFKVAKPGDLKIFTENDVFDKNILKSINYSINIPINKKYFIGSNFNSNIKLDSPVEIKLNMDFDVQDINNYIESNDFCNNPLNLTLGIYNCLDNIKFLSIKSGRMQDFSINSNIESNLNFSVSYISYANSYEELKEILTTRGDYGIGGMAIEIDFIVRDN